ncbi:hypothetical protein GGX14DRAFT_561172 [Mycena pura]|uniref:Uncharacterized protein n=1 Tax=Mycena pura TaxID=153505 RepID=A0AAD6VMV9_9AGAR|nr:hypothetical protein GGX14DRAFT_561172 [Mycena pura]
MLRRTHKPPASKCAVRETPATMKFTCSTSLESSPGTSPESSPSPSLSPESSPGTSPESSPSPSLSPKSSPGTSPESSPSLSVPRPKSYAAVVKSNFPPAWLVPSDELIISRSHWNSVSAPGPYMEGRNYMAEFRVFYGIRLLTSARFGVQFIPLVIREYYGVQGCIVPIGWMPFISPVIMFAFTIAGPVDEEGKKVFYEFMLGPTLKDSRLYRHSPGFFNVHDFYTTPGPRDVVKPKEGESGFIMELFSSLGLER